MPYDPSKGFPRIMPSLRYHDVGAALTWLNRVFGLKEHLRWVDDKGNVRHAKMRVENAFVELSSEDEPSENSKARTHGCHLIVVWVDDVNAHFHKAKAAGATVIAEPADKPWGLRQYTAEDPQGHRWEFTQHLRDVPPAEWGAVDGISESGNDCRRSATPSG